MKVIRNGSGAKHLFLLCLFAACASGPVALNVSPRIPGSVAQIKVRQVENDNTGIDLRVKHLAPPDKVASGTSTYIVWAQSSQPNAPAQNLGALKVDKDLNAEFKTITPYREFNLFVTAEQSVEAIQPSSDHLLWASVKR